MVAIIVNHHYAPQFSLELKPSAGSGKTRQSLDYLCKWHVQFKTNRNSCEGVVNIVQARHAEGDSTNHIRPMPNGEDGSETLVVTDRMRRDIGLRAQSISYAAPFDVWNDCLHVWIVQTKN